MHRSPLIGVESPKHPTTLCAQTENRMDPNRKAWNERHQDLRAAFSRSGDPARAVDLFMQQHACVHSAAVAPGKPGWSFADEVCAGLDETVWRFYTAQNEHSIAWLLWHSARIEDVTMNILLADGEQLFISQSWGERLGVPAADTGNAMPAEDVAALSRQIDLPALRAYRDAVGTRTREIVARVPFDLFMQKVAAERLQRAAAARAVLLPAAQPVLDYWGGLTYAGLLLMPPTRHNFIHLNEALRIRQKLQR